MSEHFWTNSSKSVLTSCLNWGLFDMSVLIVPLPSAEYPSRMYWKLADVRSAFLLIMYSLTGHNLPMMCEIRSRSESRSGSNEIWAFSRAMTHAALRKLTPSCVSPIPAAFAISSSVMVGRRRQRVARLNSRRTRWYWEPPYSLCWVFPTSAWRRCSHVLSDTDMGHPSISVIV